MSNQQLHLLSGRVRSADPDQNGPGLRVSEGTFPIDIDADGVLEGTANARIIVCDLSAMLGYRLGKQIPMNATFRINHLGISARNVDDANDNDGPQYFAGDWEWYSPTKHRIDAVQAWRMLEKKLEEDDADSEGIFVSSEDRYKGFRFGWTRETDVLAPSLGAPSQLPNGYNIVQMLSSYNDGLTNGGVPTQVNAIWDRKVGRSSHLNWALTVNNGEFYDELTDNDAINTAYIQDATWTAPSGHCIEVIGGLLVINVTHSSIDTVQFVDDDFEFEVNIGVSGWSTW